MLLLVFVVYYVGMAVRWDAADPWLCITRSLDTLFAEFYASGIICSIECFPAL